jgi:hypothetical protein
MAETKISDLTATTALVSGDEIALARGGVNRKIDSDFLPGWELGYTEFTSAVTVSATAETTPDNVVAAPAIAFDGSTRVCLEFFAPRVDIGAVAGAFVLVNLWDDTTTDLGRICVAASPAAVASSVPMFGVRYFTPPAATKTYRARAWRVSSNGSIVGGAGGAGATLPGFIRITKA